MQPITSSEAIFYALVFAVSAGGGLARCWLDNDNREFGIIVRRALAVGVLGFGITGFAIGRLASDIPGSPFYWLAIAALIGCVAQDVKDKVFERVVATLMIRIFGDSEKDKVDNDQ